MMANVAWRVVFLAPAVLVVGGCGAPTPAPGGYAPGVPSEHGGVLSPAPSDDGGGGGSFTPPPIVDEEVGDFMVEGSVLDPDGARVVYPDGLTVEVASVEPVEGGVVVTLTLGNVGDAPIDLAGSPTFLLLEGPGRREAEWTLWQDLQETDIPGRVVPGAQESWSRGFATTGQPVELAVDVSPDEMLYPYYLFTDVEELLP